MNLDKVYLNIALINECTEIEGPGRRFCIWLQGCNIGCKNCINKEMLSFEAKNLISIKQLVDYIFFAKKELGIEGVTLLGGEPFLQTKNLIFLAKYCKEINLSIMCFTGFKYEELTQNIISGSNDFLKYIDILVDGSYIESLKDNNRNWVGSTNQKFHYLSNLYDSSIETNKKYKNKLELKIVDNKVLVNGEANIIREFKKQF